MAKKKVTLSIDESVYKKFQKYCEDNGLLLSKKVEIYMKKETTQKKEGEKQ